jgi:hypothetical protein
MFGLSSNFPKVIEIELSRIVPNPDQPRKTFDPVSLKELAQSIEQHGLLQPVTVKPHDNDLFMLVAGERRYRAHEMLHKPTIFAIVTDGNVQELALIENVQREDLHPVELARALSDLMESRNYTRDHQAAARRRPCSGAGRQLSPQPRNASCISRVCAWRWANRHNDRLNGGNPPPLRRVPGIRTRRSR